MKTQKGICLLLAAIMAIMVTALVLPATADNNSSAIIGDASRFTIEKNVFVEGEPIYVSAIGKGKDWVGIIHESGGNSIKYYYVGDDASKGFGSGVKVDLRNAPRGSGGKYANFPAGNYTIYFFPNDGSMPDVQPIAYTKIKIVKSAPVDPKVLKSAKYELKNPGSGFAEGTITVEAEADQVGKMDVIMYWGNANGKLPGYTSLSKFKVTGTETTTEIPANVLIPNGATCLYLYTETHNFGIKTEECLTIQLPENSDSVKYENPLFSYTVVSDVHIKEDVNHIHNKHFKGMLQDVKELIPDSIGTFIVGDVADQGAFLEYKNMDSIYKSVKGAAPLYMSVGDHDMRGRYTIPQKTKMFNKFITLPDGTHPEKLHYDFWKNGYHFIFLGTDEVHDWSISTLHKDTLEWLDKTIAENYDPERPVFIFLHQPLPNTLVGTLEKKYGQYWGAINPNCERQYRQILSKYPEAILFNGHTHGLLDSESNLYYGDPKLPTIVNTAAVAYEWDTYDNKYEGEDVRGSEGYIVEVYEEKIILKGRNFETGEWVPSAQYLLRYKEEPAPVIPEETETETETEPITGTETGTETGTAAGIETEPEDDNNSGNTLKTVIIVASCVVVLAAGGVTAYVLISKKRK